MARPVLSKFDVQQLNQFENFFSYKLTWTFLQFIHCACQTLCFFTGNQRGKTADAAMSYSMRILGVHPVPKKNVLYFECEHRAGLQDWAHDVVEYRKAVKRFLKTHSSKDGATWNVITRPEDNICPECGGKLIIHGRKTRILRFASEKLPTQKDTVGGDTAQSAETNNAQYPEFKKWLPPFLIKKDITARLANITIYDPWADTDFGDIYYEGADIIVEFVSYKQSVQSGAGVQRLSVWADEEAPYDWYEEQLPRLLAEDGDYVNTVTPANGMCFDESTEIITERGWKHYNEILMGDRILTYNTDKDRLEWKRMCGFYLNHVVDKDMVSMKNGNFDALVTPDHRWVTIGNKNDKSVRLQATKEINKGRVIKRLCHDSMLNGCNLGYSDSFLALLGWVVTDGTISCNKVAVYQSKTAYPEFCRDIDKLFDEYRDNSRYSEREYGPHNSFGGNGVLCRWDLTGEPRKKVLSVLTDEKSFKQDFLCSLSKHQLEVIFNAMVDGDGHRKPDGGIVFTQSHNEALVDDFVLIATLIGRPSRKIQDSDGRHRARVWGTGTRFDANTHYRSLNVETKKYTGFIWCPSTKNQTVVCKRNGCISISGNSWTYDSFFEKAKHLYRTQAVVDFYKESENKVVKPIEETDSMEDIAVFQAASDDNPTIAPDVIDAMYANMADPDGTVIPTRRYGMFKQASGRIFKDFSYNVHIIDPKKHDISRGMLSKWTLGRGIDFHDANPWAILWAAISPWDEAFVYQEWYPSPEKWITARICNMVGKKSQMERYALNLIDPWCNKAQPNTSKTTLEDMNEIFWRLKKGLDVSGIENPCECAGGYWETWKTQGTVGRDEIKKRLANSVKCKYPFNNEVKNHGVTRYLPTLWVYRECRETAKSLKQWRLETWKDNRQLAVKERKEVPSQRFSHFCTALEALFKDRRFRAPRVKRGRQHKSASYFKGAA